MHAGCWRPPKSDSSHPSNIHAHKTTQNDRSPPISCRSALAPWRRGDALPRLLSLLIQLVQALPSLQFPEVVPLTRGQEHGGLRRRRLRPRPVSVSAGPPALADQVEQRLPVGGIGAGHAQVRQEPFTRGVRVEPVLHLIPRRPTPSVATPAVPGVTWDEWPCGATVRAVSRYARY